MKAYNYIVYALWVILAIVAKILGASWWVALSPIWFPVGVIFVILLGLQISVDVGKILKRKKAKADPDSCENCHRMRSRKREAMWPHRPAKAMDSGILLSERTV